MPDAGAPRSEPDWDQLVTGLLLVGLGVVWIVSTAGVPELNWGILLPTALRS